MKIVVLISAIAEWNAVKPLFPNAKIEQFPFGETFNVTLGTWHLELLPQRLGEDRLGRSDAICDR